MGKGKKTSRGDRRGEKRLSPREIAQAEQQRGTISATEVARREQKVRNRECSSVWADDIWLGRDRDYPAESVLRLAGRKEPRVYTGSGSRKVRCTRCRHVTPPQNCTGGVCDDCRLEGASQFFLDHLPGSAHRKLIGEEA